MRLSSAILVLLGLAGVILSLLIARREAVQYEAIQRLRIAQSVDSNFSAVQDHLALRENLAQVVANLFVPPPLGTPRPLGNFGDRVTALMPDLATAGWLPEVEKADAPEALKALAESGVDNPRFIDANGQSISPDTLDRPLYPIIDIAPEKNRFVLGVDAGAFPDRLAAIHRARDARKIAATTPLRLVQSPGTAALLLYAPVYGQDGRFIGVFGFGYEVERLLLNVLNVPARRPDFDIRVFAETIAEPLIGVASDGAIIPATTGIASGETSFERKARFGGRELKFVYSVKRDLAWQSFRYGLSVASAGLAVTLCAAMLLGFTTSRAAMLAREVSSRRSAEDRMKVLIHELNHRVRNVLSVVQAVVRLSFTSADNLSEVQKTAEGRLQALSNAMSLLTASDWKSVNLRHLVSEEIIPFADRISTKGPDIPLKARSAQTFALLLYELATNATKHGALSVATGKVLLEWSIDRSGPEPIFRLKWKEVDGPTVTTPTRRGFGELLVKRIAPRDVAGRGTASYEPSGFEYQLEAPLREILYAPDAA